MTPKNDRWTGLALIGYWSLLIAMLAAVLAVACGILWLAAGIVELGKRILAGVWPWVQANSDGLTIGLTIGVLIGAFVALVVEDKRQ